MRTGTFRQLLLNAIDADNEPARRALAESSEELDDMLLREQLLTEPQYLSMASAYYGLEDLSGSGFICDAELACRLPIAYLKKNLVLPVRSAQGELILAVARPNSRLLAQELAMFFQEPFSRTGLLPDSVILEGINRAFSEAGHSRSTVESVVRDSLDDAVDLNADAVADLLEDDSEAPFIKIVNMVLAEAVRSGASDIHIEPYRDVMRVRYRLDGVLYERHSLAKSLHAAIVSRIKVMAKLNIAERRLPQDGRIAVTLGGRQVGLRVSTLPTTFGERVVMRLLEKSERILSLSELGLSPEDFTLMNRLVAASHGMILITGPTGSGKTTSLYALLQAISSPDKNILTIEDPVEYELDGVGQIHVNPKIGLTFAEGLRSIVRQDPDVILIGEIRDTETASIAVQSSLTGHLVLSTLHTNDAPSAVTRLFDMRVEPFLLASVLRAVVAQRLVRLLCPACREAYRPAEPELRELDSLLGGLKNAYAGQPLFRPRGCKECMDTGYRGRIAIYEVLPVTEDIRRHIAEKADADTLRNKALACGMRPLRHDGCLKVLAGLTTMAEVSRVTTI